MLNNEIMINKTVAYPEEKNIIKVTLLSNNSGD